MIIKLLGLAVVTACVYLTLSNAGSGYTAAVEIAVFVIVMLWALSYMGRLNDMISSASQNAGISSEIVKTVIKLTGMSVISGFAADILEDAGAKSSAGRIEFCAKVIMLAMAAPYIVEIIGFVSGLADR